MSKKQHVSNIGRGMLTIIIIVAIIVGIISFIGALPVIAAMIFVLVKWLLYASVVIGFFWLIGFITKPKSKRSA